MKVCIGCDRPKGEPHENWCPVVTGTLSSLDDRPKQAPASQYDKSVQPHWYDWIVGIFVMLFGWGRG